MDPRYEMYSVLSNTTVIEIEEMVKSLLHASRDCMRNQEKDTHTTRFCVNNRYFGEAFGVMRGLSLLGYGYLGDVCREGIKDKKHNLRWWFEQLCGQVLVEENFGGSNECDHCLDMWGKDGAGRKRGD